MQALIMAAQLITGISLLVILHEFGHYWAAKAFGIRVEKFYLFFDAWGKKLFTYKRGETEWGIGWLPLGGYVKIAGMIDESMDTETMKQPPQPWEFRSKPAWQRLIVMVGGVAMNIIAGIIIFAMLKYSNGEQNLLNSSVKHGILPSALAEENGFRKGDILLEVNGKPIRYFIDAMNTEVILGAETPTYLVKRGENDTTITLEKDFLKKLSNSSKELFFAPREEVFIKKVMVNTPAEKAGLLADDQIVAVDAVKFSCFDEFQPLLRERADKEALLTIIRDGNTITVPVNVTSGGTIGFRSYDKNLQFDLIKYSFWGSIPAGAKEAYQTIAAQVAGWSKIFKGEVAVSKAVQGPIGIAQFYGPVWDWLNFWLMTALISLGLAFMNILPIPALDGGHVVLIIMEMITGRPLGDKAMERIQGVGMFILLTLMVFIFGNDILQIFL